jgi:hypothetical protein
MRSSPRSSGLRFSVFSAAAFLTLLLGPAPRAQAQISVQIGPAPVCPYGYFPYPPYNCAPWGYYGPEWFNGGIFIGAGPWFHGPRYWHGHVNDFYDPRHGYHGRLPHRGERDQWENGHWRGHPHEDFHGHNMYDGHGHAFHGGHPHGGHDDHGDHHPQGH